MARRSKSSHHLRLPSSFSGSARVRRPRNICALALAGAIAATTPAAATHDPALTATIFVHGFAANGASLAGIYGEDAALGPEAAGLVALAGLPVLGAEPPPPNVVASTIYYGDTAPAYYTDADIEEVRAVTAQHGGGVPRYALIVAKYARHLLERTGARQVNFVSGSFGALVVRWLVEKDVEGLASDGRIARWLSAQGLQCGNWPASRAETLGLLDALNLSSIDLHHMGYGWVDANFHPRKDVDNPLLAGILMGAIASTDDTEHGSALSVALTKIEHFQPNDGTQLVTDAHFAAVSERSRLLGLPPTLSLFHTPHGDLVDHRGAWAQVANFLVQSRRVTVTMTSATVFDLKEPQEWYWDWRPAEVVLECRTYSPAAAARWGITQAVSALGKEGGSAPIRRYRHNGETQTFRSIVFDDFVLPEETELVLDLRAQEVDNNWRYGVYESVASPSYDDLGAGQIRVPITAPGVFSFRSGGWACTFEVGVVEYPFDGSLADARPRAVPGPALPDGEVLAIHPNPFTSSVRIFPAALAGDAADQPAMLSIHDVSGRLLRRLTGPARAGFEWDGRDEDGRPVPPGVYVHRLETTERTYTGRSLRLK